MAASYKGVMSHCNSYGLRQKLNKTYKEAMERLHDANGASAQPDPERRRQ